VTLFFTFVFINISRAVPCDKIVKIESREINNYLGNVTFTVPNDFQGKWSLLLKTQNKFAFFGGWGIHIRTDSTKQLVKITSADTVDLFSGDQISFRFRLYWEPGTTMPIVNNIIWEGHEICNKPGKFRKLWRSKIRDNFVYKLQNSVYV